MGGDGRESGADERKEGGMKRKWDARELGENARPPYLPRKGHKPREKLK